MTALAVLAVVGLTFFLASTFVVLFGAPYVPTLAKARRQALDLLDLRPGQTLYELGSGDGRLLVEAAARGWRVVGYELNPLLVFISYWRTRHYRQQVKIIWGNFWRADFGQADGIFIFQIDRSMGKLDVKIKREVGAGGLRVVSHAFKIPGKKPTQKRGAIFLYAYGPVAKAK